MADSHDHFIHEAGDEITNGTDGTVSDLADDDDFPCAEDVPLPTVVAWEDLTASEYAGTLRELESWVHWLCETYVLDAAAVPNCWYAHPDIREELGHLWAGWLMTRHPQAGVGAVGLGWDRNREATLVRCRTMTSAAGCSPTQGHRDRMARQWPVDHRTLLADHLQTQRRVRDSAGITGAAEAVATAVLMGAELRLDIAAQALDDVADDPARPSAVERERASELLRRTAAKAVTDAGTRADEARVSRTNALNTTTAELSLAEARRVLAARLAVRCTNAGGDEFQGTDAALSTEWQHCLEQFTSAADAVDAAVAQVASSQSGAAILARHTAAAALLERLPTDG